MGGSGGALEELWEALAELREALGELRNAILLGTKSPCGHATAQKCYFVGTKKPLRACYCSEMQFFRYKKAPAGMSLLRFFRYKEAPAGMSLLRNAIF